MPYPDGPLKTRAIVKPGVYSLIPPEGRVFNVIPGIEGCQTTILCSPKIGASFVMYVGTANPGGGTTMPYGAEDMIEAFIWVMDGDGKLEVKVGDKAETLAQGGYAYSPAGVGINFKNNTDKPLRFILYKQRYIEHPDKSRKPWAVFGNTNAIDFRDYDSMTNVHVKDLLPVDENFDMNFHILSFDPGGCHPFIETHVQEHGAYIYEGQGMYRMDDDWVPVQKEDFLLMCAFSKQCCYGTGRGPMSYIYSKDCHRDVEM